jgi:hypothetical protein
MLMLSVIGFLPIAPALPSLASSPILPACCRSQGKHKCAMHSGDRPSLYSPCDQRPLLPPSTPTVANPWAFLTKTSQLFLAPIVVWPVTRAQIEALFRISFERSRQKRGPPSFLS